MRSGCVGRLSEAAGFVDDDRLGACERPGRRHESAGLGHRLEVQHDRIRRGIFGEVVDQVAHFDVERVADRDEIGEADVLGQRPVEDRRAERSALGDEGGAAELGHGRSEAGVEPAAGNQHAQAVRADDPHGGKLGGLRAEVRLESLAGRAHFAESGGENDDAGDVRTRRTRGPKSAPSARAWRSRPSPAAAADRAPTHRR